MKKPYSSPGFHLLPAIKGVSSEELLAMDDQALAEMLEKNSMREHAKCYQLSSDYLLREIAGEGVLVPVGGAAGNVMITLNETGAFLFKALEKPCTVEDVLSLARESYDDPDGTLENQVREFIANHLKTGKLKEA